MLKLLSSARSAGRCAYQISRPACPVQIRQYQAALRPFVDESPLPNFDYHALLVDAAGTLLIPSEPAAEVCVQPCDQDQPLRPQLNKRPCCRYICGMAVGTVST